METIETPLKAKSEVAKAYRKKVILTQNADGVWIALFKLGDPKEYFTVGDLNRLKRVLLIGFRRHDTDLRLKRRLEEKNGDN